MVAPSGSLEPEGIEGFPLVETFQDCCGDTRHFEVTAHVTDGERISFDELTDMLQSYEGWRFEIRIDDGFDVR